MGVLAGAPLSPRRRVATPRRRGVRRAGRRGRDHRRRRGPRRSQPGPEDRPRREGRLRLGDVVEVVQDDPRRAPLPAAARVPASCTRTWPSASASSRTRPTWSAPLPFLIPLFGRAGVVSKTVARSYSHRPVVYDLTGGVRIGRAAPEGHAGPGPGPSPHARDRPPGRRLPLLRRPGRRCPADPHPRSGPPCSTTAPWRPTTRRSPASPLTPWPGRTGPGARYPVDGDAIRGAGPVVVNATGVWADEVRALDEGTDPHSLRPAKGVHVTVPADRSRATSPRSSPCRRTTARSSSCPGRSGPGLPGHHRHGLRRPARRPGVHARGRRLPPDGGQRGLDRRPHPGRHHRRVGRAAPPAGAPEQGRPRLERTADLSRRHTVGRRRTGWSR